MVCLCAAGVLGPKSNVNCGANSILMHLAKNVISVYPNLLRPVCRVVSRNAFVVIATAVRRRRRVEAGDISQCRVPSAVAALSAARGVGKVGYILSEQRHGERQTGSRKRETGGRG